MFMECYWTPNAPPYSVADVCGLADTAWAFISAREAAPQEVEQLLPRLPAQHAGILLQSKDPLSCRHPIIVVTNVCMTLHDRVSYLCCLDIGHRQRVMLVQGWTSMDAPQVQWQHAACSSCRAFQEGCSAQACARGCRPALPAGARASTQTPSGYIWALSQALQSMVRMPAEPQILTSISAKHAHAAQANPLLR